jgi:hypothetical protein
MASIQRRTLLAGAGAAYALIAARAAQAAAPRVRKDIVHLTDAELRLYHDAVQAMRANEDYADPRSWMYWAWMHDYEQNDVVAAVAGNKISKADACALMGVSEADYDQGNWPRKGAADRAWSWCPHHDGDALFLPWHRAYLLFFEDVLRSYAVALDARAGAALNIPYFDAFAARGEVPAAFASPTTGWGAQNALYYDRSPKMDALYVNHGHDALMKARSTVAQGLARFADRDTLQGAHDDVHVALGDPDKDMGTPYRAARDPIFWSHHANVDRQWRVLDAAGAHSTLTTPAWQSPMPFRLSASETRGVLPASMRSLRGLPVQQRYEYQDHVNLIAGGGDWRPLPIAPMRAPGRVLSAPGEIAVQSNGALSLARRRSIALRSGELLALNLSVPSAARNDVHAAIEGVQGETPQPSRGQAVLVLEDVRIAGGGEPGSFLIAVGWNGEQDDLSAHVVGTLSRWELATASHHMDERQMGPQGPTLRFDLSQRPELGSADASSLSVWLIPANETPGQGSFTIGEARLEFSVAH